MKYSQITEWCHEIIRTQAKREGLYIDATMGKGADTAFLCELAGEQGHVIAFDIQEVALDYTKKRLENENLIGRAELILDGHEHMARYAGEKTVDLICFNFGYLPGGNHEIATRSETSVQAVEAGLSLLKSGGMMCLCIYSGGDTGFEEKNRLMEYLKNLPAKTYTVIVNQYFNRVNQPPIPVFVWKS